VVRTNEGEIVEVSSFEAKAIPAQDVAALQSSCDGGTLEACTTLGNVRQNEASYAEAERAWRKACDGGVADGCHELGNMLSNPFSKLGRESESVPLFQKACDLDHVAACYFLGGIYDRGEHGVAADPVKARALYERGCKNGHHWACKKVEVGQVASGGIASGMRARRGSGAFGTFARRRRADAWASLGRSIAAAGSIVLHLPDGLA
jgi:TPR repeat protein